MINTGTTSYLYYISPYGCEPNVVVYVEILNCSNVNISQLSSVAWVNILNYNIWNRKTFNFWNFAEDFVCLFLLGNKPSVPDIKPMVDNYTTTDHL